MKINEQEKASMIAAYRQGRFISEITRATGRNFRTVQKVLRAAGVIILRRQQTARRLRKYSLETGFFHKIDNAEKAYWLGFLTADAHVWRGTAVQIRLQAGDYGQLEKLKLAVASGATVRIKPGVGKSGPLATLQLCSREMAADLSRQGCCHPGTLRFPPACPADLIRHYLRGLWDGDGHISFNKNRHGNWPHASFSLCGTEACVELFRRHMTGVTGTLAVVKPHRTGIFYFFTSGNRIVKAILDELYSGATVWLDRKREAYLFLSQHQSRKGGVSCS